MSHKQMIKFVFERVPIQKLIQHMFKSSETVCAVIVAQLQSNQSL